LWHTGLMGTDMKTALIFPGQGSQRPGMGRDMATRYPVAREVFEEVDDALGRDLSGVIWDGDEDALTLTSNAQPAIMATSIATLRALECEGITTDHIDCMAGHSLGEYTALCASGVFSLADTARLLQVRGNAMQSAVTDLDCAMAAILGIGCDKVAGIVNDLAGDGVCDIANDNDPVQVVISGHEHLVEDVMAAARAAGARRAIKLQVSAPFHSRLMEPAINPLAAALADVEIGTPGIPVLANVNLEMYSGPDDVISNLTRQVTGTVRWRESMLLLEKRGVERMLEIGPGNVLTGLARRCVRSVKCIPVGNPDDIDPARDMLEQNDES